jgi:hypothetical protein
MSTPERQQDEGEYGYGAAEQGSVDDDDQPRHAEQKRAEDAHGRKTGEEGHGQDPPSTTGGREQAQDDQQTG